MISAKKEKTNLYLNKELKQRAKEELSKYGLTLSAFTNLMLAKFLQNEIDLLPKETQSVINDFETKKNFENPISIEDFLKEIK